MAFLAWVGLGADGLSSSLLRSARSVPRSRRSIAYLAVFLSLATIFTVFVISACYSHIIEEFPSGGGGYLVASKLLGRRVGVVSGCALLVDYVLTITVSDGGGRRCAVRPGRVPSGHGPGSSNSRSAAIIVLIVLNLRGIKESVKVLLPIFILFLITHAILIFGALGCMSPRPARSCDEVSDEVHNERRRSGLRPVGHARLAAARLLDGRRHLYRHRGRLQQHARDARAARRHGQADHDLHGLSLALTAGGLMIAYLLLDIAAHPSEPARR